MKLYMTLNNKVCALPPSFGEMHLKLPNLYSFNCNNSHFTAYVACITQDWLQVNCPWFTEKNNWPPNSPDSNPLDYHVLGSMLAKYNKLQPKHRTINELKVAV